MNDESKRRKDALLHRYLDGEIDKPTYDAMLARLESQPPEPPEASPPGDDLDRMATVGRASPMGRLEPGVDLGGFRLVEIIGCGGMGQVWKAHDPTADRTVVVKVVPPDVQHNAAEMARVRDTFRRIHTLHHEHICPVYVLGEDPRCGHFVVMQFIAGRPLSEYRRERTEGTGVLTLTETIRILRPVAAALDYAHRQKVVHRDVKPDNILVTGDGDDVQVVDFGLAAEIHTSMSRVSNVTMETSGTRPYMAPEQWRGEYQDARTDQYALAVVAYELLAGRLPFESADAEILRLCVLNESPPEIGDQDDSVNGALARGMAKRREDRFADCTEFIAALEAAAPGDVEPGEDDPPIVAEETSPETGSPLPAFIAAAPPVQVDPEPPIVLQPAAPRRSLGPTITNSIGMKLMPIPAGEFLMGSPDSDADAYRSEKPRHRVTMTRPFCLGVYQVTQAQYERVRGANPSHFHKVGSGSPVETVSWDDAFAFCLRLSQQPEEKAARRVYRLPSEAEWEYACRADGTTRYFFGDDEASLGVYAWYEAISSGTTHPVGLKEPNAWGLYDMAGNVWEWCADRYDQRYYELSPPTDPPGPESGSMHVRRGGGWYALPKYCRSADRFVARLGETPCYGTEGFRVACDIA